MDYGPFGFMDEFDPLFAKWTGSGQHFGFMNQPNAGYANYGILVESVVPLIAVARGFESKKQVDELQKELLDAAVTTFQTKLDQAMRIKLGFDPSHDVADELWEQLEPLMQASRVDWTLFFRELSYLVRDMPHIFAVAATDADSDENVASYDEALTKLIGDDSACPGSSPFYEALTPSQRSQWLVWIESWIKALSLASVSSSDQSSSSSSTFWNTVVHRMLETANPKYVLREWMLVDAYQGAAQGDERKIRELQELTQSPYAEGTSVQSKRFYRRTPDSALTAGGTAFMS